MTARCLGLLYLTLLSDIGWPPPSRFLTLRYIQQSVVIYRTTASTFLSNLVEMAPMFRKLQYFRYTKWRPPRHLGICQNVMFVTIILKYVIGPTCGQSWWKSLQWFESNILFLYPRWRPSWFLSKCTIYHHCSIV